MYTPGHNAWWQEKLLRVKTFWSMLDFSAHVNGLTEYLGSDDSQSACFKTKQQTGRVKCYKLCLLYVRTCEFSLFLLLLYRCLPSGDNKVYLDLELKQIWVWWFSHSSACGNHPRGSAWKHFSDRKTLWFCPPPPICPDVTWTMNNSYFLLSLTQLPFRSKLLHQQERSALENPNSSSVKVGGLIIIIVNSCNYVIRGHVIRVMLIGLNSEAGVSHM